MGRIAYVLLTFSLLISAAAVEADIGTSNNSRFQGFHHGLSAGPAGAVPADSGFDNDVSAIAIYNGDLVVGGSFFNAPGGFAIRVAGFDGSGWYAMNGIANGNPVYDLHVHNGELYAGYALPRLNKWDGASWTELTPYLGNGIQGTLWALTTFNNQLVVGGSFRFDTLQPSYVAMWNGSGWDSLGTEISSNSVNELIVFNGELVAGGFFSTSGGSAVNRIARWNGTSWSTLGGGITGPSGGIRAMTIYNNELIAGGSFLTIGGISANYIARWDGASWQPLGDGLDGQVYALVVHDGKLIAGGLFQNSGANPMAYVASWDGSAWSALGNQIDDRVNALGVYNGYLIAGGRFSTAGGYVALWDNVTWRPVLDIATDIDEDGEALLPAAYSLDQNYPNPFNPATTIRYSLEEPAHVEIEVISVLGQLVRHLVDRSMPAGKHEIQWDGTADDGQRLASGTYFYRLRVGDRTETRKLLLLK